MNKYKKIAIHTENRAQKLAALYHLSAISGVKINQAVLKATLEADFNTMRYPYVFIDSDGEISSCKGNIYEKIEVPFNKMSEIDSILENSVEENFKVGSVWKTNYGLLIKILLTPDGKYVISGNGGNLNKLYVDESRTKEEMIQMLKDMGATLVPEKDTPA